MTEKIYSFTENYNYILEELMLHEIGKAYPSMVDGYLTYIEAIRANSNMARHVKNILYGCYSALQEQNKHDMRTFHYLHKKALDWKDLPKTKIDEELTNIWSDIKW